MLEYEELLAYLLVREAKLIKDQNTLSSSISANGVITEADEEILNKLQFVRGHLQMLWEIKRWIHNKQNGNNLSIAQMKGSKSMTYLHMTELLRSKRKTVSTKKERKQWCQHYCHKNKYDFDEVTRHEKDETRIYEY